VANYLAGQKKGKIYWHGPFFEGLQLDLHEYRDYLTYEKEHELSKEALKIDVVVVKKKQGARIDKDIARIFRGHNLIEFKSEKDSFSIRDYNKVMGYAQLYSSFLDIPLSDITVTVALTMYPEALERYLANEWQQKVESTGKGIYHVTGEKFPVQILESKKLSDENIFLRNLRSNLTATDAAITAQAYGELKIIEKKNVYLDGLIKANPIAFEEAIFVSEEVREIIMSAAEKTGWLDNRITQTRAQEREEIARRMLLRGGSVEELAEVTELPREAVIRLL
jgi:hypothetical protein